MITYNGKNYETRQVLISPFGVEMPVTVAREELWYAIKDRASHIGSEEMSIDDHICYYCNEQEWAMSDTKLAYMLESL